MPLLQTRDLVKTFGGLRAVDGVSIDVEERTLTLIIGPNGSGKSTLINLITGFLKADSGSVIFSGEDITNKEPNEIYHHGIVRTFQTPQILKSMSVIENLLIANVHPGESPLSALRKGSWLKTEEELVERAFSLLKFLKLDHLWDRPAGTLSGGQMKLLEIGRALMTRPKMIVMDEPVAGVAPSLAHDILGKLVELKKEGITVLLIEHRLDIVLGYVDHLYVMFNGKILTEGRGKEGIERVVNDPRVAEIYMGG
jgi:branched-chain amino acid transport system ATP-binding protein